MIATLSEMLLGPSEDLAVGSKGRSPNMERAASKLMEVEEGVGVHDDAAARGNANESLHFAGGVPSNRRLPYLLATPENVYLWARARDTLLSLGYVYYLRCNVLVGFAMLMAGSFICHGIGLLMELLGGRRAPST